HPDYSLTVVEIDPQVTETAFNPLGLNPNTRVVTHNEDGRFFFLHNGDGGRKYDLVFGDAFNDLSVPYHLTTLEFSQLVKAQLKENGMYVANIIDDVKDGEFLQAFMNTQAQAFNYVTLFSIGNAFDSSGASTYVVAASDQPIDLVRYQQVASEGGRRSVVGRPVPAPSVKDFLNRGRRLVLTDDFVPVDNLVAPILARSK
ncbi:MAG: fused MFS/spermidine synthase, partial [Chloroflexi bacterium]|nr:fused MFS/spermidine synthase [Chloroflexota bacterium]